MTTDQLRLVLHILRQERTRRANEYAALFTITHDSAKHENRPLTDEERNALSVALEEVKDVDVAREALQEFARKAHIL